LRTFLQVHGLATFDFRLPWLPDQLLDCGHWRFSSRLHKFVDEECPTGFAFSAGYDHPTPTSAYFAVFFRTAQQTPHPFLVVEGVAGFPEEQLTVLDHFKF
jgi:hypothetical protein